MLASALIGDMTDDSDRWESDREREKIPSLILEKHFLIY
jgi:hypothetical protein